MRRNLVWELAKSFPAWLIITVLVLIPVTYWAVAFRKESMFMWREAVYVLVTTIAVLTAGGVAGAVAWASKSTTTFEVAVVRPDSSALAQLGALWNFIGTCWVIGGGILQTAASTLDRARAQGPAEQVPWRDRLTFAGWVCIVAGGIAIANGIMTGWS